MKKKIIVSIIIAILVIGISVPVLIYKSPYKFDKLADSTEEFNITLIESGVKVEDGRYQPDSKIYEISIPKGTDEYNEIVSLLESSKYYRKTNFEVKRCEKQSATYSLVVRNEDNSLYISFAGSNLMYYNDKYFNTSMFGKGNIEAADRLAEIVRNYD